MRHRKKTIKLDRKKSPREALIRNLATSLVLYEKIQTTKAKAKAVAPLVEKYITISKKGDLTARRQLLKFFYDQNAVNKLLDVIAKKFSARNSGYTRIMNLKRREGDGAEIVLLEILEN